jgi:hypothetical protein
MSCAQHWNCGFRVLNFTEARFQVVQYGRIYMEKLNGSFLSGDMGKPAAHSAGLLAQLNSAGSTP